MSKTSVSLTAALGVAQSRDNTTTEQSKGGRGAKLDAMQDFREEHFFNGLSLDETEQVGHY